MKLAVISLIYPILKMFLDTDFRYQKTAHQKLIIKLIIKSFYVKTLVSSVKLFGLRVFRTFKFKKAKT